ncbi:DUF4232 domain-containing protein [Streptomyces sp. NPDC059095]|uniref:DUF4232 domain-containing protein n=1 Tax=Streptomyces sp. NPDC059095 TaxID=3346726 RepID=UPI000C26E4C6|nr:hypothetical protein CG740_39135 [Streptomyces sp. CB01201]
MHRIAVRHAVATSVGLTAVLALTACGTDNSSDVSGSSSSPSSPVAPSTAAASRSASTSSGGSSSSGTATGGSNSSPASSTCHSANLRITAKNQGEARQGVGSVLITFTNKGGDCRMAGFPGVDLKTNYGNQAVDRNKQEVGIPFTLRAGKTATADVVYPMNDTGGSGVHVTALVITPPNETHPITAPVNFSLPVSDKDTGRLEVTPVFKPVS